MRSLDEVRALLARRRGDEASRVATPEPPVRSNHPVLSSAQASIWAQQQIDPTSSAYNLCLKMTLTTEAGAKPVDEDLFIDAFLRMVRRHEVLRTTYHSDSNGEPWQLVHNNLPPEVRRHAPDTDLATITRNAVTRPFDLAVDSPVRLDLVKLNGSTLVVVMTLQHIVWDGMTMSVLAHDLGALYSAEEDLPALAWQVADFAAQESTIPRDAEHAYWRDVFRDGVPQLPLPTVGDTTKAAPRRDHRLSDEADANLRHLAREIRVTPFAVFLSAYHLALRLVSGQPSTVIGTTVANREQPGQERLFGNFSNQIPLLINSEANAQMTFGDLVVATAQVISGAFRHKMASTEAITVAAGLDRSIGDELFRTMVLFLTRDISGPRLPGTTCTWELVDNEAALYPLTVEVFQHPESTEVQFTHQEMLAADLVDAIADFLETVLADATPQSPLGDLLRPGRADQQFLAEHAMGPRRVIEPTTVDAMLRQSASRGGQHCAVVVCEADGTSSASWTYEQFDAEVNQLTRELLDRGVATGDRVLVVTGRVSQLPMAMAAVLRAGACYVPVDPKYPHRRIRAIVEDAVPSLVLVAGDAPREESVYQAIPVLDMDLSDVRSRVRARRSDEVTPDELTRPLTGDDGCYLIYTSGSTGRPKGVLNLHLGVANHLQWYGATFLSGQRARVLQKAPVTFDVGLAELLNPLSNGGAVVLPPREWWEGDAEGLVTMVAGQGVQVLSLVPSYLRVILDTVEDPSRMSCIEHLLLGGEAVPGNLATRARELLGCHVYSLYGPTEAAMDVTCVEFTPELVVGPGENLIGTPEDNVTVRLLDPHGHEVPIGVPGELCLVGVQVADGYRNLPDETREAFDVSPIAEDGGSRMYRTGDIASWRRDGQLVFHGRIGEQVKVRGNRVELGEVEAALLDVPGVRQAASRVWGDRLIGYVVLLPGTNVSLELVREVMAREVPGYMVIEALVEMPALPITARGKLDRGALPEPEAAVRTRGELRGMTLRIAEVLAETLDLKQLPRAEDSLFSLGGDSIAAIRVVAGLRRVGFETSARNVLGARSLTELAERCRDTESETVDQEWGPSRAPLPPLAAQLVTSSPQDGGVVQFTAVAVARSTTVQEVADRLQRLLHNHPVLGARLLPEGWLELPEKVGSCFLENHDGVDIEDVESLTVAARRLSQELAPRAGRMMAAGLFGAGDRRCLVLAVNHLVIDGVSWRVLQEELADPSETVAENGFLRWSALLADQGDEDEDARWLEIMRRSEGRILLDPEADIESTASTHRCLIGEQLTSELFDATRQLGCDLLDLQLAAAVMALCVTLPKAGAGVTVEGHGRDTPTAVAARAENAVGWFTAAWPILVHPTGSPLATLWAVRAARHDSPRDTSRPAMLRLTESIAVPDLCVNYLGVFDTVGDGTRVAWQPMPGVPTVSGWANADIPLASPLDLTTELSRRELRATLRVAGRHISKEQAEQFLSQWREELVALVAVTHTNSGRCPVDFVARDITDADVREWNRLLGSPIRDVLPLTALQRSLLLSSLATGGGDGYIVQSILDLRDDSHLLTAELLAEAAGVVVNRHPSMAVAPLSTASGRAVGVVTSGLRVPVVEFELPESGVTEWLKSDSTTPFDLTHPPLMRLALLRTDACSHLVITCHHLITDGWTGQLLMLELARVLSCLLRGDEQQVSGTVVGDPETFPRAASLISEQQHMTRQVWSQVLEPVSPLVLAGRRDTILEPRLLIAELPIHSVQRLIELAAAASSSLNMVCQLAWACALSSIMGDESVVFGEVVSGRTLDVPRIEESIGCYANTVPGPVRIPPDLRWREALTELTELRRRVLGWEHLSLVDAHHMVGVRKLFDTLYVFQSYPAQHEELAETLDGVGLQLVDVSPGGSTDASAVLMIFPSGSVGSDDTLRCYLHTAPDVFDEEQSRIVLDIVMGALAAMATDPDATIGDCVLMDEFDQFALDALRINAASKGYS